MVPLVWRSKDGALGIRLTFLQRLFLHKPSFTRFG
jgi:hypothetical protein